MTPSSRPPANIVSQLSAIERGDDDGEVDFGRGARLHVSSLGKIYFPSDGVTKGAVMRYYARIAPVMLPHLADRPLVLKRYPDGVAGPMFFQQDAGRHVPDTVRVHALPTEAKGKRVRIIGGDLLTLLYTVQLGAIEVHPWLSRISDIGSADRCLIDLDPGDDVPFPAVVALARDILRIVKDSGLPAAVKTSGSRGLHIVLPLPARTSYETSARLAMGIAQAAVVLRPERATIERSLGARPAGTIYVDAMQNARGKSAASVYSIRARNTPTVSSPLKPSELTARLRMGTFTAETMPARIARLGDIWGEAMDHRPAAGALARAMHLLEAEPPAPSTGSRRTGGKAGGKDAGPAAARRRTGRA